MHRRQRLLAGIDVSSQCGLEIGALCDPIVLPAEGRVQYVDYLATEQLRERYLDDPTINVKDVVKVDYIWNENTLRESVGSDRRFDYVIASHVIEHIPDVVSWLKQIAEVLSPGGVLSLAVPDKRYIFDCLRQTTTTADLVDSYLRRIRQPTIKQVYDFISNFAEVDSAKALKGDFKGAVLRLVNPDPRHAYRVCRDQAAKFGIYLEAHCGVFTPDSFITLLADLSVLELLDYRVAGFHSDSISELEFFVTLERLDDGLTPEKKLELQEEGLEQVRSRMEAAPAFAIDGASRDEIQEMLDRQATAISRLSRELSTMKNSRSWRLTQPLRRLLQWMGD